MTPRQLPCDRAARLARARHCLDAYGATRARWPAGAAALFDEFADDPDFCLARNEAAALDDALAFLPTPEAGEALKGRILGAYALRRGGDGVIARLVARSQRGLGRLIPAGALAGLSALGIVAGAASAGVGASGAESDSLYYAQATFIAAENEEDAFWAVE